MIDLSEGPERGSWAPLPDDDRVVVGGRTVWLDWSVVPVVVSQPNRWGVIEQWFPPVPCIVECDPVVAGDLPWPETVVGWLDRFHEPIEQPRPSPEARATMKAAGRLASRLDQVPGVRVAARPIARTIPLVTQREAVDVIERSCSAGVTGLRPLMDLAGGVVLSVAPGHTAEVLDRVVEVMRAVASPSAPRQ